MCASSGVVSEATEVEPPNGDAVRLLRERRTAGVLASGLALTSMGIETGMTLNAWRVTETLLWITVFLAIASVAGVIMTRFPAQLWSEKVRGRAWMPSRMCAPGAIALLGVVVTTYVVFDLTGLPHHDLQPLDWLALAATYVAILAQYGDRSVRSPAAALYAMGLVSIGMLLVYRAISPGKMLIWTSLNELTGFLLVMALIGWSWSRLTGMAAGRAHPAQDVFLPQAWFAWSQAFLSVIAVLLSIWIVIDPTFCGMGAGKALLGLTGHTGSCPAALMLVGTAILMAWQTRGTWRGRWQYAALAAGVLFSTSIGWARLDGLSAAVWSQRVLYLLMSAVMMTLLTRFGLARVLPGSGDWLERARRAAPVFGAAALLLAAVALLQWAAR